jgi:uncharacterized damage-inducible protein DinB
MESQSSLLNRLDIAVRQVMIEAREDIATQTMPVLRNRPADKKWNALETLAHLNSFSDLYLPKFELAIHRAKARKFEPSEEYISTWLGRYKIKSVAAENRTTRRQRTAKRYNFINKELDASVVKAFIINQEILLRTIAKSREIDINKTKVSFAGFPYLKLSLGQFLEFFITHQQRHMLQAKEMVEPNSLANFT